MKLFLSHLESPLGELRIVTDADHTIRAVDFADHSARMHRGLREHYGAAEIEDVEVPQSIARAFADYFSGKSDALDHLQIATAGTELQQRVWGALRTIPAGTTTTYGKLAKQLGFADPRAAIDIGAANAANPIALIVPCHRVIASNGDLKGYAWGVHRKRWLLEHEAVGLRPSEPKNGELSGL
jgi:methylated-DNA-[protein]-cysteine S-methyltransferase